MHGAYSSFEVYGPRGIAQLLFTVFSLTSTYFGVNIVVNEILDSGESLSGTFFFECLSIVTSSTTNFFSVNAIYPDADGYWTLLEV